MKAPIRIYIGNLINPLVAPGDRVPVNCILLYRKSIFFLVCSFSSAVRILATNCSLSHSPFCRKWIFASHVIASRRINTSVSESTCFAAGEINLSMSRLLVTAVTILHGVYDPVGFCQQGKFIISHHDLRTRILRVGIDWREITENRNNHDYHERGLRYIMKRHEERKKRGSVAVVRVMFMSRTRAKRVSRICKS